MSVPLQDLEFAPGARVLVRDVEWVIRRIDLSSDGGQQLTCDGVSELVRGQQGVFLTSLEEEIKVLDPAKTRLVPDHSPGFVRSRLFIESQLRQAVPNDDRIHIGHMAAMEHVPYQLDPARQALRQHRHRILIADAVGLGKTLEAGVLVSELIARGRGRRILVLAVKSMLTQFQKEFWNRFTIPLARLDSDAIQRVRSRIPTNHNPFHYFDKSIISIDTLKRDREYRTYLESAYWDIIVIDEAHNVADRGTGSLRSRLAKLLSKRSDTLIMLSATPHDGRAHSFASLMNMLDPTAIADPGDYRREDFSSKGLVVRRFKKDILHQVREAFRDRRVHPVKVQTTAVEEEAFDALLKVRVNGIRQPEGRDLFAVTLEKALFSSPVACRQTVEQRIRRRQAEVERPSTPTAVGSIRREIASLMDLCRALEAITKSNDSRYQQLVRSIRQGEPFWWDGRDPDDRLVIFTERIATLEWLRDGLITDLGLKEDQVKTLHGNMSDIEQQQVVEEFGNREAKVRLLICSDVASEGINLHFRCHRLIHYDMPWSLMVFQQRNGRIDRFGQAEKPQILYLVSSSSNPTIRGDQRILQVLREKDEQAYKNIGDPSVFMNVHAIDEEEKITENAVADGQCAEDFDKRLTPQSNDADDLMTLFLGAPAIERHGRGDSFTNGDATSASGDKFQPSPLLSVFPDDLSYCEAGLHQLREMDPSLNFECDPKEGSLSLDAPGDLEFRFRSFPREIWPEDRRFDLTTDIESMRQAIDQSRREERAWPRKHYLWRQNPVVEWLNDRMVAVFGRHEAPVLAGVPGLRSGEVAFAFSGLVPNRKSHPVICILGALIFRQDGGAERVPLERLLDQTRLQRGQIPNRGGSVDLRRLNRLRADAVALAIRWVKLERNRYDIANKPSLETAIKELEALKQRQVEHAKRAAADSRQWDAIKRRRLARRMKDIDDAFRDHGVWVRETIALQSQPWVRILAVMTAEE